MKFSEFSQEREERHLFMITLKNTPAQEQNLTVLCAQNWISFIVFTSELLL